MMKSKSVPTTDERYGADASADVLPSLGEGAVATADKEIVSESPTDRQAAKTATINTVPAHNMIERFLTNSIYPKPVEWSS